ncbi:MAG TPA: PAS domain-containing protein, partial [Planctomycetaceae bacterium]
MSVTEGMRADSGGRAAALTAAAIVVLTAVFFLLDLVQPTGAASGVLYIVPVLISVRLGHRRAPLAVAAVATLLTIGGFFLPVPPQSDLFRIGVGNRAVALMAIWCTAVPGYLFLVRDALVREREHRLRAVIDTTPDLIVTIDAGGRIESCNASAAQAFGSSGVGVSAETPGRPLAELLGPPLPGSDESLASDAVELIAEGRPGSGVSSLRRDPRRTIRWTVRPLDAAGCRLAVGHDLTELLEAQDRAVRAERLAAIGQTLATLSHESKNELLAIRFGLEQLGRSWDDREAAADLIAGLLESQDRLWRLFEDVRGYAAPIRLRPAQVRLTKVWRRAWDSLAAHRAGRDAKLVEHLRADSAECVADPFRLEQVFRNLFENALAACPDPLRIEVTCSERAWRGEPALSV